MTEARFLLAIALTAGLFAACGSGNDAAEPETLGLAEQQESLQEAQERITRALASGDCDRINEGLNPLSRQPTGNTVARCAYLRRLEGLEPSGAERYGGGAVLDYEADDGDRVMSAALVLDADGLWRIAYIDPYRTQPSVGTRFAPNRFDAAAEEAVAALGDRDCERVLAVAFRKFGWWAQSGDEPCVRVEQNRVASVLDRSPFAEPERLGGNAAFAFYSMGTPGVTFTLVFARQSADDLPERLPEGVEVPDDAAEYAYVDAYRTNERAPTEGEQETAGRGAPTEGEQ